MLPNFQCMRCGSFNPIGEAVCKVCGENFIYYCPVCYTPVDSRYSKCPNCGDALYWGFVPAPPTEKGDSQLQSEPEVQVTESQSSKPQQTKESMADEGTKGNKSILWIILTIICIMLIAAILVADKFISK